MNLDDMENKDNYVPHDQPLHVVTPLQWVIIFVLGLGMLFGFYAGCGSNHFGVTKDLPPVQAPASPSSNK